MSIQVLIRSVLAVMAVLCFSSVSFAQADEDDGPTPNEVCKDAAKTCKNVKFKNPECKELRDCKKKCRQAKRGCKKEARGEKKECRGTVKEARKSCISSCGGKKGKAKRKCKRACRKISRGNKKDCRQDKRSSKKGCRGAKRACKKECRKKFLTPACKTARKNNLSSWAKCAAASAKCVAAKTGESKEAEEE